MTMSHSLSSAESNLLLLYLLPTAGHQQSFLITGQQIPEKVFVSTGTTNKFYQSFLPVKLVRNDINLSM